MSDTTTSLPSLADRVRHARCRRHGGRRAFPQRHAGVRAGRGGLAVRAAKTASAASPCIRAPSSPAPPTARAIVTGGDDGTVVTTGAGGTTMSSQRDDQQALGRSSRARARWRGRLVGGQDRARAHRQGRGARIRSALDGGRAGVCAERLPARHRALQRLHALVPQCQRRPAEAGMEGLASRRHRQPGQPLRRHHDAGADAARLAHRRREAHAHVGLFGARALAVVERGRRLPRHLGLRAAHSVAVRRQGRARWAASRRCWRAATRG